LVGGSFFYFLPNGGELVVRHAHHIRLYDGFDLTYHLLFFFNALSGEVFFQQQVGTEAV